MSRDRVYGGAILCGSIGGIAVYFWLVFISPWSVQAIQATAFIGVAAILAILAWIGYVLATTPPPPPIAEIETETDVTAEGSAEEEKKGGESQSTCSASS